MTTRDDVLGEYMDRPDCLSAMADEIVRLRALEADAARFAWLVDTEPFSVCTVAWRVLAACAYNEPRECVDVAMAHAARGEQP
jgi:hypothetical protein